MYIFDTETGRYSKIYRWRTSSSGTGWHTAAWGTTMATDVLEFGHAVFISKGDTAGELTFSGKVSDVTSVEFGTEAGNAWSQVIFPYPEDTALQDMNWTNMETGDRLYIFDSETGRYSKIYRWRTSSSGTGWHTAAWGTTMATDTISYGSALFVNKVSAGVGSFGL